MNRRELFKFTGSIFLFKSIKPYFGTNRISYPPKPEWTPLTGAMWIYPPNGSLWYVDPKLPYMPDGIERVMTLENVHEAYYSFKTKEYIECPIGSGLNYGGPIDIKTMQVLPGLLLESGEPSG